MPSPTLPKVALPEVIEDALSVYSNYQYQLSEGDGSDIEEDAKEWEKARERLVKWLADNIKA
jgi:hypothetical protein